MSKLKVYLENRHFSFLLSLRGCLCTLLSLQMSFLHPHAFADEAKPTETNSEQATEAFSSDSQNLRGAFEALRDFANSTGSGSNIEIPEVDSNDIISDEKHADSVSNALDASEQLVANLNDFTTESFEEAVQDFSQIKLEQLPKLNPTNFTENASLFLLGGIHENARNLFGRIISTLFPDIDISNINIQISGLLVPKIITHINDQGVITGLDISAGAIAFSENIDELAAQIASSVSAADPKVYGFSDDPRFYRLLGEKGLWDDFQPELQHRIKQDLAALEKIIAVDFRAESLTRFEMRIFSKFNKDYSQKVRHKLTRKMVGVDNINAFEDDIYEVRVQIQKLYLAYIQNKSKTSKSFQAKHPFNGRDKRLHRRMRAYVTPFYSSFLHWFGLPVGYILPQWLYVGWTAANSYFGLNFGNFKEVMTESDFDKHFGQAIQLSETPEWLIQLSAPIVKLGSGIGYVFSSIWHGVSTVGVGAYNLAWSFNDNILTPWVWSPIGSLVGSIFGAIGNGASWTWETSASAFNYAVGKFGQGLDYALPEHEASTSTETTFKTISNNTQSNNNTTQSRGSSSGNSNEYDPITSQDGYNKLLDWGGDYFFEGTLAIASVAIAYHYFKHPAAYKTKAIQVKSHVFGLSKALYKGSVAVINLPGYFFNGIKEGLTAIDLNDSEYGTDQYIDIFQYLLSTTISEKTSLELPSEIKDHLQDNYKWVSRRVLIRAIDHWLIRLKQGKFSKKQIEMILASLTSPGYNFLKKAAARRAFSYRAIEIMDYLISENIDQEEFPENLTLENHDEQISGFFNYFNFRDQSNLNYFKLAHIIAFARRAEKENNVRKLIISLHEFQKITNNSSGYKPFKKIYKRLFRRNFSKMANFIFLDNQTEGEEGNILVNMYTDIINAYRFSQKIDYNNSGGVRSIDLQSFTILRDFKLAYQTVALALKSSNSAIANGSIREQIGSLGGYGTFSNTTRRFSKAVITRLIKRKLKELDSISEIVKWVEEELIPRNTQISEYAQIFYNHIISNPDIIKNSEDLNAIFENDYFWLQLPVNDNNVSKLESYLVKQLRERAEKNGGIWKYSPAQAEVLHQLILNKSNEFNIIPTDFDGKLNFWLRMTEKGVTSSTDKFFWTVVDAAKTAKQTNKLEEYAIIEGRIWETSIASALAIKKIKRSTKLRRLLKHPANADRLDLLQEVIEIVKLNMPDRGIKYAEFLENLSVEILSTAEEAILIDQAKKDPGKLKDIGDKAAQDGIFDENVMLMKSIFKELHSWRVSQIIDFVMYLRGAKPASKKIKRAFSTVGPERIKRIFETLPLQGRWGLLDSLFTHVLLSRQEGRSNFINTVMKNTVGTPESQLARTLIGGKQTQAQQISYKVLDAFLYAMNETGNDVLTTYIFSYLYALPPATQSSPGETLKHILETLGTLFVKFGQILAATNRLPPEENVHLADLREGANIPSRGDVYQDLGEILGVESTELPFSVKQVVGGASIKYAVLAHDELKDEDVILKIFRLAAINNRETQYAILDRMAERLISKGGSEFLIFQTIADAAKQAVEDEVDAHGEVEKSARARKTIYAQRSTEDVIIEVPVEELVNERLIVSAFADGMSFNEIKEKHPEVALKAAKVILEVETDILFNSMGSIYDFEPDRHDGNYRIAFEPVNDNFKTFIRPIDMGQLTKISVEMRDKIVRLFAISQILYKVGANKNITNKIADLFDIHGKQKDILARVLRKNFPDSNLDETTAYFSLLSAVASSLPKIINEEGLQAKQTLHRGYVDFIRAILQTTQYQVEGLDEDQMSPARYFHNLVSEKVNEYGNLIELSSLQKVGIHFFNTKNILKAYMNETSFKPLPTDLKGLVTKNVNIEEAFLNYDFSSPYLSGVSSKPVRSGTDNSLNPFTCKSLLGVGI